MKGLEICLRAACLAAILTATSAAAVHAGSWSQDLVSWRGQLESVSEQEPPCEEPASPTPPPDSTAPRSSCMDPPPDGLASSSPLPAGGEEEDASFDEDNSFEEGASLEEDVSSDEDDSFDPVAEQDVSDLTNAERTRAGLSSLTVDERLCGLARQRAVEISQNFSHSRPDGSSCFTILEDAGLSFDSCGENIASGYTSASSVMDGWTASPSHQRNILSPSYSRIGTGCYLEDGARYWVQIFLSD